MNSRKKRQGQQSSIGIGVGVGILASILLSFIGVSIITSLVMSGKVFETAVPYLVSGIHFLSVLVGTLVAAKLIGEKIAVVCAATASGYMLTLIAINAFGFEGQYPSFLMTLAMIVAAIGGSVLISSKKGSKRKYAKVHSR